MKALNIIETAYRATLEEQDDTIVWITHAMRNGGAHVDVLLRGHAVNYAIHNQDASGLAFGDKKQTQPPHLDEDVRALMEKGAKVFIVEEDLADRGIEPHQVLDGLQKISQRKVAGLFESYDRIWNW